MKYSVKIYGSGSIGNHLANAFRVKDFDVYMTDISNDALNRAVNKIYPERYGIWDDNIKIVNYKNFFEIKTDVVFIGTPPEFHIDIAIKELENSPKIILIEKPLCEPSMKNLDLLYNLSKNSNTKVLVGYNHVVSKANINLQNYLTNDFLGHIQSISSYTREHWGGIFKAHPWLDGPKDSYLGYSNKGGGALCEHSHALNMWIFLANYLKAGKIERVTSSLDFHDDGLIKYDKKAIVSLVTNKGISGDLIQDVVSFPTVKTAKVQGDRAYAQITFSHNNRDIINYGLVNEESKEIIYNKTRPQDFIWEVEHVIEILEGKIKYSPISLDVGIETMCVIEAIFRSAKEKKEVYVNREIFNYE